MIYSSSSQYQSLCLQRLAYLIPNQLHPEALLPYEAFYDFCRPTKDEMVYLSDLKHHLNTLENSPLKKREIHTVCSVFKYLFPGQEKVGKANFIGTLEHY